MTLTSFDDKLSMFARLLVTRGLNVQPGEFVQILFESGVAEELALRAAEYAYDHGARHVHLAYTHPRVKHVQLTRGPVDERFYFPLYERMRNEHIVDSQGCFLDLRTNVEPDIFNNISEFAEQHHSAYMRMRHRFYSEGINKGKTSWCLACPPSPKAAWHVYPEAASIEEAYHRYWNAVFRMTMSDQEDCIERWEAIDLQLVTRSQMLNDLAISELQFVGPGTLLSVGLSRHSNWLGGSTKSSAGKRFSANVPSFEVFTTPDRRMTNGFVRITRPVTIANVLVEGLHLEFEDGKIVDFDAKTNKEAYATLVTSDEGACQLGEVALVGLDSPVYQEGVVFNNTLYDENAACHIATGSGYARGIKDGWHLTKEQLREFGRNESITHEDLMISGPGVDVTAFTYGDHEIALLRDGHWVV